MPVADLAQTLQIASRRNQNAGRAGHGFHHDGGDRRGVVELHQPLEVIGEMRPPVGLPFRKGVVLDVVGMSDMVDARDQTAIELAVLDDTAHGGATEIGSVIAALAADEPGLRSLAPDIVIAQRDLERRVSRFGSGIREEDMIEVAGHQLDQTVGKLEGGGMAKLEGRPEIHAVGLRLYRLGDLLASVAGIAAPQARRAVQNPVAVGRPVMHVLCAREQARRTLESPVRREGHPERSEVVGPFGVVEAGMVHDLNSLLSGRGFAEK